MPSTKIKTILSPLAVEYLEKKKQVSRDNKPESTTKTAKQGDAPEDTVTISSEQPEDLVFPVKPKSSQAVTFEEKQALKLELSVRV
jgi:hypothetical protein